MPNNTTVNKVIINGVTRLDLTGDTATPSDVAQGKTFHDASGALQTGTASGGGGDNWSWMGKNPTLAATVVNEKVYLKDTGFATWTPSTSSTTIVSQTNLPAQTINAASYDYIVLTKYHCHMNYDEGTTGKYMVIDNYVSFYAQVFGTYTSLTDVNNDNPTTIKTNTSSTTVFRTGITYYLNGSGVETAASGLYGPNPSATIPYSASSSSIVPRKPAITVSTSASYFSTANAQKVNQDTSYYELKIELWRVDKKTTPMGAGYKVDRDMWVNGF